MKLPFGSQGLMGSTLSNTQETPTMHASSSGDNGIGGHPGNGGDNGGGNNARNIPVYAITIPFSSGSIYI